MRKTTMAIGAAALLGACAALAPLASSSATSTRTSQAKLGGTVVVGSEAGEFWTVQQQNVVPLLAKEGVSVKFSEGDYTNIPTKLKVAAKGTAPYDVIELEDIIQQQVKAAGLLQPLTEAEVPNLKYVPASLRNQYWVPFIQSAGVLVYNKDKVKPAPTSYDVLFEQKYKGRVAALNFLQYLYAAAADAKNGNPGSDWAAGWPLLKQYGPSFQISTTSWSPMGQALEDGQAWLGITFQSYAHQWASSATQPLGIVVPEQGSNSVVFDLAVPKNAPDKKQAYAYINAMLAPSSQQAFAKALQYGPVTTNAALSPSLAAAVAVPKSEAHLVQPMNPAYVDANITSWETEWDKVVEK